MHSAALEGRNKAAATYGLEKVAFNWGGAAKWGGRAAKVLGIAPSGLGNIASAALGGISGVVGARAEGHGWGASLLHGAAGATAGIPGGLGQAASVAAPMALNKLMPPPPPPGVGQNITG